MGQAEIYNLLCESKKPLTAHEIADILQIDPFKVIRPLKMLLKFNEIQAVELDKDLSRKVYKCKKKIRVYYI